jgi:hypothetical protein
MSNCQVSMLETDFILTNKDKILISWAEHDSQKSIRLIKIGNEFTDSRLLIIKTVHLDEKDEYLLSNLFIE